MINTYSYRKDGNNYISAHFQVKEFGAVANGKLYTDKVLIDSELINKLEEIFSKCDCSKAIVSSGYRNVECDKAVGGTGVGQHILGCACDICFYNKSGKVIPSKIICCIAQDLGFKGIAYITESYVHLDNRSTGIYKGDETRGTNSVTTNFYNYFNLSKDEVNQYIKNNVIKYQVYDNVKKKWLANVVVNSNDYAGIFGNAIGGIYIDDLTYKAHDMIKNKWLPEVTSRNDYAGILGNSIDGVMIKNATYRVHLKNGNWLSWVKGYNNSDSVNGYAGILGKTIDAIQIKIS